MRIKRSELKFFSFKDLSKIGTLLEMAWYPFYDRVIYDFHGGVSNIKEQQSPN